tara:strand:+ start:105 stop:803 length:699 start_codon:yes stop_codon:yes gene_type:complete
MSKTTLIIPIYNEELNIKKLFEEIVLIDKNIINNIIFIDDCSTDNSLEILEEISKDLSNVKILKHAKNMGQSKCLQTAIKYTENSIIITIDGDGQNNPKDIPKLLDAYLLHSDVFLVGGLRHNRKDNIIKIVSSKVANRVRSYILKDNCKDTGCSLKVFDRNIFLQLPFFDGIHRFLPALYKGYGKKTLFLNVDHRSRVYGKSKYGTFLRLFRGIKDLILVVKIIKDFNKNK